MNAVSMLPPTLEGRRVALAVSANDTFTPAPHLAALGAGLVFYPCAEMMPLDSTTELDLLLHRTVQGEFDWLLLATAEAVRAVAARLAALGLSSRDLQAARVAAYGAITRLVLADVLPEYSSPIGEATRHADLVNAMHLSPHARVLLLEAAGARTDWVQLLTEYRAQVTSVPAYRLMLAHGGDPLPAMLWSGQVDAMVFTSEDNVRHFTKRLTLDGGALAMLDDVYVACIDPQTATAAQALGVHVQVVPAVHSPEALAQDLARFFASRAAR